MSLMFCRHRRYSWPLSLLNGKHVRTYVVCLDCGREMTYSWEQMRIVPTNKGQKVKEQKVRECMEVNR